MYYPDNYKQGDKYALTHLGTYQDTPDKYKTERIILKDYKYKTNDEFEKEIFKIHEENIHIKPIILEHKIEYVSLMHSPTKNVYDEEQIKYKQYGDIKFYNWLYLQNDPNLAVLAEIINAPKLNNKIEKMRDKVKELETITILNFAKHKKLGSRQILFIKQMKEKYGNNILKFLNLYM